MSEWVVEVTDLSVKFGDHQALEDLNLQIPPQDFVAIVGPNGAGKSTFLKVLLGLIKSTTGEVRIFNRSPQQVPPHLIGYVPQVKTMDRSFPARAIELVLTGLQGRWPWKPAKEVEQKALQALERVGAQHLAYRPLGKVSGGELQRICLARSIAREPKLLMLDEPATGVDAIGEADLYRYLEDYQKEAGATILIITHDWHVATHHANHVLLLNQKQISFGTPREALSEDKLRIAFGHVGHEHSLKFLVNNNG
ncbi:MAG: ABC transporter ATP-binding protein [Calditrichia bacterium]